MPRLLVRGSILMAGVAMFWFLALRLGSMISSQVKRRPDARELSVFEPHAGGCIWTRRSLASGESRALTTFHVDCAGVRVSFRPNLQEALVFFPAEADGMLWRFDLKRARAQRLSMPSPGEPVRFLYDREGRARAFTLDQNVEVLGPEGARYMLLDGEELPVPEATDGTHALARGFVLDGDAWRPTGSAATRCCAPGAPGLEALTEYAALARDPTLSNRRSEELLGSKAFGTAVDDNHLLSQLDPLLPSGFDETDGSWIEIPGEDGTSLIAYARQGYFTGLLRQKRRGEVEPLPSWPFTVSDHVALQLAGESVLITEAETGMRARLYDRSTGELLYENDVAHSVTFWPKH